jgi:hypothetical protein
MTAQIVRSVETSRAAKRDEGIRDRGDANLQGISLRPGVGRGELAPPSWLMKTLARPAATTPGRSGEGEAPRQ